MYFILNIIATIFVKLLSLKAFNIPSFLFPYQLVLDGVGGEGVGENDKNIYHFQVTLSIHVQLSFVKSPAWERRNLHLHLYEVRKENLLHFLNKHVNAYQWEKQVMHLSGDDQQLKRAQNTYFNLL